MLASSSFLAIDIGNTSLRAGYFDLSADTPPHVRIQGDGASSQRLPQPIATWRSDARKPEFAALQSWLAKLEVTDGLAWYIASVYRPGTKVLREWLAAQRPRDTAHLLTHCDVPLSTKLLHPERAGVDRLLAAVAANQLRPNGEPAVVVDAGSAVTIDSVDQHGTFLGGLILPGRSMMLRALAQADLLPELDWHHQPIPELIGTSTEPALLGGVFWGQLGAIEGIVERLRAKLGGNPLVVASGGELEQVAQLANTAIRHVPHLVLSGIAVTVQAKSQAL